MMVANASTTSILGFGRLTNYEAVGHGPLASWLVLIATLCAITFLIVHKETWRRIWLAMEDPRTIGLFRIVFGILTILNVNSLWELFEYLFTDEGMWTTDVAQQMRAKEQFIGYGDGIGAGESRGFYDFGALLEWLKGPNYSLLLFDSSPRFFWAHLIAFELAMVALVVGWQTRWVKWVALFLFHSIILRNHIYWEGTENVYRCYFFYLCLSRCEAAYSVDNWLRCRRLRKQGRLSEVGKPGQGGGTPEGVGHAQGLEAIYRSIPAWPRLLMIMQFVALYTETGVVKNGPVWNRLDAMYYALNLDHFYRLPPQPLAAIFGTSVMRLSTFVVHTVDIMIGVVILGLVWRFHHRERIAPLTGWALRTAQVAFVGMLVALTALVIYLYPDHYRPRPGAFPSLAMVQWSIALATPLILGLLALVYRKVRHNPATLRIRGRSYRLDLDWLCRWFFGRRIWVLLLAIFQAHVAIMMSVGWFNFVTGSLTLVFLNGRETGEILFRLRAWSTRRLHLKRWAPRWSSALPSETPLASQRHRDGFVLPTPVLFTALALIFIGVVSHIITGPTLWQGVGKIAKNSAGISLEAAFTAGGELVRWNWFLAATLVMLVTATVRQIRGHGIDARILPLVVATPLPFAALHHFDISSMAWSLPAVAASTLLASRIPSPRPAPIPDYDPRSGRPRRDWAYGPWGRLVAGCVVAYHMTAVAIWLSPDKDSFLAWRPQARGEVSTWLATTQTTQGWRMFAPNPPRSNVFMRTLVTDRNGEVWDLMDDVYACFEAGGTPEICDYVYPIPWVFYTRQRKINRRVGGGTAERGGWWQKWHARAVCKAWTLEHGGEMPSKVDLVKVWYPMPSPNEVWKNGPYDPKTRYQKTARQQYVHTTNCINDPTAQTPNYVRERHGMPLLEASKIRPWYKNRCRGWEKKLREQARARGETVDNNDPRFKICGTGKKLAESKPKRPMG